ncbi:MAG: hypothetical protein AAF525_07415 [Pseudomonadota bacterium]
MPRLIYLTIGVMLLFVLGMGVALWFTSTGSQVLDNQTDSLESTELPLAARSTGVVSGDDVSLDGGPSMREQSPPEEKSIRRRMFEWMMTIKGFDQTVPLNAEEQEQHRRWGLQTGFYLEDLSESDYATYTVDTLFALAEQGDMRALAVLQHVKAVGLDVEARDRMRQLGMIMGSNWSLNSAAREAWSVAQRALDGDNREAYRIHFVEQLALYELAQKRGDLGMTPQMMRDVLGSYQLEDSHDALQEMAVTRAVRLEEEINAIRQTRGWQPLRTDPPSGVLRLQAAQRCEGDRTCLEALLTEEFR